MCFKGTWRRCLEMTAAMGPNVTLERKGRGEKDREDLDPQIDFDDNDYINRPANDEGIHGY